MTIRANLPMVFLMGGPLEGFRRTLIPRDLVDGEPPRFLAAIPGGTREGSVMRPPLDPPPSISRYEKTEERLASGEYVYDWRPGAEATG